MKRLFFTTALFLFVFFAAVGAAKSGGWHVVSMKRDWQRIFSFAEANIN